MSYSLVLVQHNNYNFSQDKLVTDEQYIFTSQLLLYNMTELRRSVESADAAQNSGKKERETNFIQVLGR